MKLRQGLNRSAAFALVFALVQAPSLARAQSSSEASFKNLGACGFSSAALAGSAVINTLPLAGMALHAAHAMSGNRERLEAKQKIAISSINGLVAELFGGAISVVGESVVAVMLSGIVAYDGESSPLSRYTYMITRGAYANTAALYQDVLAAGDCTKVRASFSQFGRLRPEQSNGVFKVIRRQPVGSPVEVSPVTSSGR